MDTIPGQHVRCTDCARMIRLIPILFDHAEGCIARAKKPKTDRERAQALAIFFEGLAMGWPEAGEAAELLKKVK